jgi:hypothetical protein
MDAVAPDALIEDAAKKSGLIWVRATGLARGVGAGREQPVWHVWQNGAVYVLTGGLEQPAPGGIDELPAPDGDGDSDRPHAVVTARGKDGNSRLLTFEVSVARVPAGSEEWDALVPALVAKRLNLPDGEAAPRRWASECTLWQLRPTGTVIETVGDPSTESHAAAPPPTPARSRVPRPWHLRGRPARNRGGH